jgi:hypothetical protein
VKKNGREPCVLFAGSGPWETFPVVSLCGHWQLRPVDASRYPARQSVSNGLRLSRHRDTLKKSSHINSLCDLRRRSLAHLKHHRDKSWIYWRNSFLRHPGLAQTSEVSGLKKRADLRHAEISYGLQTGDARIAIVAHQPAGFREFDCGMSSFAFKGIGRGKVDVNKWC